MSKRRTQYVALFVLLLFCCIATQGQAAGEPTSAASLVVLSETKEVQVVGVIYPTRFNSAQGEEAHYHLLVWQGGTSANALIETAADDLVFHDALLKLGGQPGDNLMMAAWTERHDAQSAASQAKILGSPIDIRISWEGNPAGIPVVQALRQSAIHNTQSTIGRSAIRDPQSAIDWRFGGNRARWFNRVPLVPRPGCLACLYSCPSGKVSNGALSIHDYVTSTAPFRADIAVLPPDGTPVTVTFRLLP